eukprot:4448954-Amphidinium_carterae.1
MIAKISTNLRRLLGQPLWIRLSFSVVGQEHHSFGVISTTTWVFALRRPPHRMGRGTPPTDVMRRRGRKRFDRGGLKDELAPFQFSRPDPYCGFHPLEGFPLPFPCILFSQG